MVILMMVIYQFVLKDWRRGGSSDDDVQLKVPKTKEENEEQIGRKIDELS